MVDSHLDYPLSRTSHYVELLPGPLNISTKYTFLPRTNISVQLPTILTLSPTFLLACSVIQISYGSSLQKYSRISLILTPRGFKMWISEREWDCEFEIVNFTAIRIQRACFSWKIWTFFFEWTAFKYVVKWLGALVNSLMLKARWKTLFLSSLIKNNVFSWYNSQSKRNLQNFNLFWRLQFLQSQEPP